MFLYSIAELLDRLVELGFIDEPKRLFWNAAYEAIPNLRSAHERLITELEYEKENTEN